VAGAIVATGFKSGGYFPAMWSWVTFALVFVLLGTLIVSSPRHWSRREVATVGGLACLAGWTLLSGVWSVDSSQSIREAERALLYVVALAAILLLAQRRCVTALAAGVCAGSTVVLMYALGHYLFASHPRPEGFEGFLLFRPVGYANAVGILAAVVILLVLGFAAHDDHRAIRSVAAGALVPLAATLALTGSVASWLALGIGAICMVALERDRARLVARLLAVSPAPALAVWLAHRADLSSGTPFFKSGTAERLGLELVLLTAAAAALGAFVRIRLSRRAALIGSAVALAAVVVATGVSTPAGASGGPRSQYWHVAWHEWRTKPLLGTGGGTFARYWELQGTSRGAQDAHNLYLETLAELGPFGLLLLFLAFGLPLTAAIQARRERSVPALFGGYAAYLAHAGVDWDWEMPVVTLAALGCAAALLLARSGRDRPVARSTRTAALAVAAMLMGVACVELVANDAITLSLGG
jgi:O-antigen ligase